MVTLQNRIQKAQGEQNFQVTIQECEQISSMVQQMEQAVNQQINQHQGQNGFDIKCTTLAYVILFFPKQ